MYNNVAEGDWEIYLTNLSKKDEPFRITSSNAKGSDVDGQPSISQDGKKILFTGNRTGNFDLWIVNIDGSELKNLTADCLAKD